MTCPMITSNQMEVIIGQAESIPDFRAIFSLGNTGLNSSVVGFCAGSGAARSLDTGEASVTVQAKTTLKTAYRAWDIRPSYQNSIYKDNAHVQSNSIVLNYWRRLQ